MHLAVILVLLVLAAGVVGVREGLLVIPDRWNPWATLRVADPPGWLTRWKVARLAEQRETCHAVLAETSMRFARVPDRTTGQGCELTNAVRVLQSGIRLAEPLTLACPTAVAFALWERHAVQPAAQLHLGARIARIEHYGSYACRNVYGRHEGRRSRHATADAVDVAAFVLEDGRRIRVSHDWAGGGERGLFLRAVRDGACRFFDGVLSPDYNAAHRDHFHIDRGPYRVCR